MNAAWERAVKAGDADAVRRLLQAGTDAGAALDVTAKDNLSALMLAVVAGHVAVARRLARAGADLTIAGAGAPGFHGKTAYGLAVARNMAELYADLRPHAADGRP